MANTSILDQPTLKATEGILIGRLRAGDESALRSLYDKYSMALQGVIMKIVDSVETSEDLLQETFVKIWQNFDSYDESKGRLFTWMLNIARNLAIDKVRSPKYNTGKKIRDIEDSVSMIDLSHSVSFQPDHIGLKQVVERLRPEQKEVIDMVYFFGYSQSEAAEKLDIPLGTVKTRIRSAVIELRKIFK
jgi:RNA polymerase sigma factor (sigma-70 family)